MVEISVDGSVLQTPKMVVPDILVLERRVEKVAKRAANCELSRQMSTHNFDNFKQFCCAETLPKTVDMMASDWASDSYVSEAIRYADCDEGRILIMGRARQAAQDKWAELSAKYLFRNLALSPFVHVKNPVGEDVVMESAVEVLVEKPAICSNHFVIPKKVAPKGRPKKVILSSYSEFREPEMAIPSGDDSGGSSYKRPTCVHSMSTDTESDQGSPPKTRNGKKLTEVQMRSAREKAMVNRDRSQKKFLTKLKIGRAHV